LLQIKVVDCVKSTQNNHILLYTCFKVPTLLQIEAVVHENGTTANANDTAVYSVYNQPYKATPVEPLPLWFGAGDYSFDVGGNRKTLISF